MDYFRCYDYCGPPPVAIHGDNGRKPPNCDYHHFYDVGEDELTLDTSGPMDFSVVSSVIVQRLFPAMVEQEVSSTVDGSPPLPVEDKDTKLPPPPPMLPPCRVCGEKASGFHYGANTCEACKGFFRRSLQRKDDYRCTGGGDCEIGVGKRNACAYCRYQKCLAIGMSKTAIKTGRYTHEKKTRDIQEVKSLQKKEQIIQNGRPALCSLRLDVDCKQREEKLEDIIKHITDVHLQQTPHTTEFFEMLPKKEKEFLDQRSFQQKMFGPMKPISKDEYMKIYQSTGIDIDGRRELLKHMIPCIEKAIRRFICFAKSLPGFKDLPISDQISLIKESRFEAWLISAYQAFNSEDFLFTHVCGYTLHIDELSKVHDLEFLQRLFKVTSRMKELKLSTEEECILKGVIVLSRVSKSDAWLILTHRCFNPEYKLFTPLYSPTTSLEELSKIHNKEYLEKTFNIAIRLKFLGLTMEETVTLTAFTMMFADRCDLQAPAKVEECQNLILEALLHLFHKLHPTDKTRLGKAMTVITEMRSLAALRKREEEKMVVEWHDKIEFPKLMYEMWST